MRQIKEIMPDAIIVSGNSKGFPVNMPVILKKYNKVSCEMRGFYWLTMRHIEEMTGLSQQFAHDCIRYQVGQIRIAYNANLGEYQEVLMSTNDNSMNNDEFWKFFTDVWRNLTQVDRKSVV